MLSRPIRTQFVAAAALLVAHHHIHHVAAQGDMLRFGCSQLVIERTDPIVQPGVSPSAHTHQIVGGNSFNVTVLFFFFFFPLSFFHF